MIIFDSNNEITIHDVILQFREAANILEKSPAQFQRKIVRVEINMDTKKTLITKADKEVEITTKWCIDDVLMNHPELTPEQAEGILDKLIDIYHIGIINDTIWEAIRVLASEFSVEEEDEQTD